MGVGVSQPRSYTERPHFFTPSAPQPAEIPCDRVVPMEPHPTLIVKRATRHRPPPRPPRPSAPSLAPPAGASERRCSAPERRREARFVSTNRGNPARGSTRVTGENRTHLRTFTECPRPRRVPSHEWVVVESHHVLLLFRQALSLDQLTTRTPSGTRTQHRALERRASSPLDDGGKHTRELPLSRERTTRKRGPHAPPAGALRSKVLRT